MKRLERLVAMALFLGTRRRVLARDVAERFDVSLRTVYRDVRALAVAGFPVEGTAGDGYKMPQESYLRPLALTAVEAEALTIAAHAFGAVTRASVRDALARATDKLEAALDRPTLRRVLELKRRVVVPDFVERSKGPSAEVLDALRERQLARVSYLDPRTGQRSIRDIEALGLGCLGDAWWLVAYCRLRSDARAFRLDGLERWEGLPEHFEPREGLSFSDVVARDSHLAPGLFGVAGTTQAALQRSPPRASARRTRARAHPSAGPKRRLAR
jgi:predicted DNA-binding transcriptional regulator YafY